MKTLTAPNLIGIDVYDNITNAKQARDGKIQKNLRGIRPAILKAYGAYIQLAPSVDTIVPITVRPIHKKSLLHTYSSSTKPLRDLKEALESSIAAARCPFCQISESSTLDHYLPKERYPEFSVLPQNLIPCCSNCNTHKRALILDKNTNIRFFIHPYYDVIPNINFIKLHISFINNKLTLSYSVYNNGNLTAAQYSHLKNHFDKLNLAERFRKASLVELAGMYDSISRFARLGAIRLSSELLKESIKYSAWGVNYWRNLLFHELANNQIFINGGYRFIART